MPKKKQDKNEKSIFKVLAVLFLIGLLIILGYFCYARYINKPEKINVTRNLPDGSTLVEGNTFGLKGIACTNSTETECDKEIKVAYSGKNHTVKIKRIKKINDDITTFKNEIYIDDVLIDTLDGGTIYDSYDKAGIDFDGYLYIVDNKYLAIVTPFVVDKQINYVVNYYYSANKLGKGIDLINGEQTICEDNCDDKDSVILNSLESLDFNGKVLKYWKILCEGRNKQALQIGILVQNDKVITKYLSTNSEVDVKGACN